MGFFHPTFKQLYRKWYLLVVEYKIILILNDTDFVNNGQTVKESLYPLMKESDKVSDGLTPQLNSCQPSKLKFFATNSFGLGRLFYKSSRQLQNFRRHGNQTGRNLEGWLHI